MIRHVRLFLGPSITLFGNFISRASLVRPGEEMKCPPARKKLVGRRNLRNQSHQVVSTVRIRKREQKGDTEGWNTAISVIMKKGRRDRVEAMKVES